MPIYYTNIQYINILSPHCSLFCVRAVVSPVTPFPTRKGHRRISGKPITGLTEESPRQAAGRGLPRLTAAAGPPVKVVQRCCVSGVDLYGC